MPANSLIAGMARSCKLLTKRWEFCVSVSI